MLKMLVSACTCTCVYLHRPLIGSNYNSMKADVDVDEDDDDDDDNCWAIFVNCLVGSFLALCLSHFRLFISLK